MSTGPDLDLKRQIKEANDIVDLIGSELQLRRQGSAYVCHCPWHDDQRPSLQINPARQSWVCWVCDIRGDVFDYVMRRENVDFKEAFAILAERANIPITVMQSKAKPGSPQDKKTLYNACAWAENELHRCLLDTEAGEVVRDYLAERGITDESVEEFKIGFAPASYSWLMDRARHTEFTPQVLEACGLVKQNDRGWYEWMRGRVIFPIRDIRQRAIAFGGRHVPGVLPEDQQKGGKYVNSPETRLFSKSETLYGLNMVRETLSKSRCLTVVEGYTDVIAAWQVGVRNVVACLGVALNERHIRIIKRFADEITLVLDGDAAGQKRSNEILELFVAHDVDLKIMTLPEGQDPFDFFMQKGSEAFQSLVDEAPDALTHKIQAETRGIDLVNETHAANQALERILSTLASSPAWSASSAGKAMRREQILTRLARDLNLDVKQISSRLRELRANTRRRSLPPNQNDEQLPGLNLSKLDRKELELLELVIEESAIVDTAIENISPGQFAPGPLRELYEQIVELFHEGEDVSFERLMLQFEDPQLKNILVYIAEEAEQKRKAMESQNTDSVDQATQMASIIQAFNDVVVESGNRAAISRLQQKEFDEQEEAAKLEELFQQMKQRQGL